MKHLKHVVARPKSAVVNTLPNSSKYSNNLPVSKGPHPYLKKGTSTALIAGGIKNGNSTISN